MFSLFKKKKIISHLKLSGVIGNVGRFRQGIEYSSEEEIIKKAFSVKKALAVAITINSPGGSPVQSHLICKLIKERCPKNIALIHHGKILAGFFAKNPNTGFFL